MPGMLPAPTTPSWKKASQYLLLPIRYPIGTPMSTAMANPMKVLVMLAWKSSMKAPVLAISQISRPTFKGPGSVNSSRSTLEVRAQMATKTTQPSTTPEARRSLAPANLRSVPSSATASANYEGGTMSYSGSWTPSVKPA